MACGCDERTQTLRERETHASGGDAAADVVAAAAVQILDKRTHMIR